MIQIVTDVEMTTENYFPEGGNIPGGRIPAELHQPDVEIGQFRRLLKTFLFEARLRRVATFLGL